MSKLTRAIMKVFGETGGTTEFAQIGSKAAGSPATSKDITTIQALSQYLQGQAAIVSDQGTSKLPYLEDRNALDYLMTSQLTYLFQSGIPEWLNSADQRYYANASIVQVSGSIYLAIKGDDSSNLNVQKAPATNPEWWRLIYQADAIPFWDTAEASAYDVAGVVVDRHGIHYTSSGKAGNSAKDPTDPANAEYWFPSPGAKKLEYMCKSNGIIKTMHAISNRAGALFAQNILVDKITKGSTIYDLFLVALDGSIVTGDATLEAILTGHPYLDIIAPDSGGTRTLIDVGEHAEVFQSDSGESDTLGEVQEDRMQGGQIGATSDLTGARNYWCVTAGRDQIVDTSSGGQYTPLLGYTGGQGDSKGLKLVNDGTNGDIRSGYTTRGKQLVGGCAFVVAMVAE